MFCCYTAPLAALLLAPVFKLLVRRKIDENQSFLLATHLVKSAKSVCQTCNFYVLCKFWVGAGTKTIILGKKPSNFCLVNNWFFWPLIFFQEWQIITCDFTIVTCSFFLPKDDANTVRDCLSRAKDRSSQQCQKQTLFLLSLISSVCKTRGACFRGRHCRRSKWHQVPLLSTTRNHQYEYWKESSFA